MKEPTFGELLREFRIAAGLSQEELAERARLSSGAVSTLERSARRAPQHQTLGLLAEGLRLGPEGRAQLEAAAAVGRRRGARGRPEGGAVATVRHNVPNVLTSFRGREAELERLGRLMPSRRIITLLGPGGVGKTRLALEAARKQLTATAFADGIWLVEFAPLGSAQLVTTAIARVLGVREQTNVPLADTLIAAIGTQRMLFLFDNCEHLIEECARVAERVSRECPNAVVLATTREALQIDGECVLRVEPLAYECETTTGPAVDVLIDRLTEADFNRFSEITADDVAHVATICRRLDGIPLALELAAGRARDLPLAAIAEGLIERFALLARGRRTAVPRQQTLRGMIDWSFALLSPAEQHLFARLGLFAEGFSPEAAAAICGEDGTAVRDALGTLIAKSLVSVVETASDGLRYRLLETMRAYALARLRESGELDRYADRFARYFCSIAKAADACYGRIPNRDFLALVEPELDNFRAALDWALGERHDPLLGAELAGALGWTYRQCSLFAEGTRWCERALFENGDRFGGPIAGRLHMALSFFHFNMGEMQHALDDALRAGQSDREGGTDSDRSWALAQQAYCLYLLGRHDEMRTAAEEAVRRARLQTDPLRLATALNAFALTIPHDRSTERIAALEEAIRAYHAAGDDSAIVPTANLAETYYAAGDAAAALSRGLDVVAMTRKNLDRPNLSAALTNVAAYALTVGDVTQAERSAREALHLVRDLGKTMNAMCALQHVGTVEARRGNTAVAARLLGAASRLYAEFGLGREYTEQSLYDETIHLLRASVDEAELDRRLDEGGNLSLDAALDEALAVRVPVGRTSRSAVRFDDTPLESRTASRRR